MDGSVEMPASFHSSSPGLLFSPCPSLASSSHGICHRCYFLSIHTPRTLIPHSFQHLGIWEMKAESKNPHCSMHTPYTSSFDQEPH